MYNNISHGLNLYKLKSLYHNDDYSDPKLVLNKIFFLKFSHVKNVEPQGLYPYR